MDFSLFCACGPAGYAQLKSSVDTCASQGRSYAFSPCQLPAGCQPAQAQLGFWRDSQGTYLLYFRPAIRYDGPEPRLRDFFSRGDILSFPNFTALTDCLQGLDTALYPEASPTSALFRQIKGGLQQQVLGQGAAVEAAAFKLWSHISKREPLRPLSLIFYGPTGVGKSELGKAIAPVLNRCLETERYQLVWTELNTFTQAHSAYRLTGAPPGYVGYDDPPVLEAVRRCPYTVFMFDELDKAHPEVLKVFMSILDEGRCTARQEDKTGSRELDFRRCIFLFTTNTDLSEQGQRKLGFAAPEEGTAAPLEGLSSGTAPLAQRLFQADESARLALTRSGVLREIAGRFSGLLGVHSLDQQGRAAVTAKQIAALGREYGLDITQVSPAIAQALTPQDALSLRSSVPMLEGLLTPVFLSHSALSGSGRALRLAGTPEQLLLLPA